jgi:hypothetical protein
MENRKHSEKIGFGLNWGNFRIGYDGPGKIFWGILLLLGFIFHCYNSGEFSILKLYAIIPALCFITGFVIIQKKF